MPRARTLLPVTVVIATLGGIATAQTGMISDRIGQRVVVRPGAAIRPLLPGVSQANPALDLLAPRGRAVEPPAAGFGILLRPSVPPAEGLLPIQPGSEITDASVYDPLDELTTYRIVSVRGGWISLRPEREEPVMWVKAEDIFTIDQEIARLDVDIRVHPNQVKLRVRRGLALMLNGENGRALTGFDEAIRLDPTLGPAYRARGRARRAASNLVGAIADFTEAIRLDPRDESALDLRASALKDSGDRAGEARDRGYAYLLRQQYPAAVDALTLAIRLDPNSAQSLALRAAARIHDGKYLEGIADLDDALRFEPDRADCLRARGECRIYLRQFTLAIKDLDLAIHLDPKSSPAFFARGEAHRALGDVHPAIADYDGAIGLDPKCAQAYAARGSIRKVAGEHDLAIDDLTKALLLDPTLAIVYVVRGSSWLEKREFDRAIADCDAALEVDPELAIAFMGRADARRLRGDFARAIEDYGRAIAFGDEALRSALDIFLTSWTNDKNMSVAGLALSLARMQRAFCEWKIGRYAMARADYAEAIRLGPKFSLVHNSRAWFLATCPVAEFRDGKGAVSSATIACELTGWRDANALDTLAAALAESGDFAAAVKRGEEALALFDDEGARARCRNRLALYKGQKPYRQQPAAGNATSQGWNIH